MTFRVDVPLKKGKRVTEHQQTKSSARLRHRHCLTLKFMEMKQVQLGKEEKKKEKGRKGIVSLGGANDSEK